jgi:hypothetical protein
MAKNKLRRINRRTGTTAAFGLSSLMALALVGAPFPARAVVFNLGAPDGEADVDMNSTADPLCERP